MSKMQARSFSRTPFAIHATWDASVIFSPSIYYNYAHNRARVTNESLSRGRARGNALNTSFNYSNNSSTVQYACHLSMYCLLSLSCFIFFTNPNFILYTIMVKMFRCKTKRTTGVRVLGLQSMRLTAIKHHETRLNYRRNQWCHL